MWKIKHILEADYGCEERMPGELLKVRVTLESDEYEIRSFEVADDWLTSQGLDEGDEWPSDLDEEDETAEKAAKQQSFMENYLDALDAL